MTGTYKKIKDFEKTAHSATQITNRGNPFSTEDITFSRYSKANGNGGFR